ncbi:TioE family transcriptional regulator [Nocardiopsis sp. HUAS JQ3]|uniref:TioE family transcriptional regulator n=1 Tax=Nocardiopsis sp. HUAS JQ3 TaxID=3061629 RepID=UPI0023A91903|nr:TioE family transcriptional regulator [Nocardiopsis sp. HUAS JQ3]WDZ93625.1 TioE family transcriptional regulator [Nocardiopsis sp. HUAS JQ3]
MAKNLQSGDRLRPIDLARGHGLSTQAVRNYEDDGILPAADRTRHGYRTYTPLHARALSAFTALVSGHGHQGAASIMRAVNGRRTEEALRLIDEGHAQLLEDRRTLRAVEEALRGLEGDVRPRSADPAASGGRTGSGGQTGSGGRAGAAAPPRPDEEPGAAGAAEPGATFIGPLADRLGVRPATLRAWERAGLVRPRRDPRTGYRVYGGADVRDALLVHQLRRGGYLLEQISPLIAQVRSAGGLAPLEGALRDWRARLSARGRAMLAGAAELEAYLRERETV